jgi:hypothetical protein
VKLTPEEKAKRLQKRRENASAPAHFKISPAPTAEELIAVIKKTFGRSFMTSVSQKDGKTIIEFAQRDTGGEIMSLADLEALLGSSKDVILGRTRDADPLPHFYVGRDIKFVRANVMAWIEKQQAASLMPPVLPPIKGKIKKVKR